MYYLRLKDHKEILFQTEDMQNLVGLILICFESGYDVEIKSADGGLD